MASTLVVRESARRVTHVAAPSLPATTSAVARQRRTRTVANWLLVAGLIYLLISAVSIIGSGFKTATGDQAEQLFQFATNPIVGLTVGIVATALIQSSSTVTSIIVGLVAGGLPVSVAVPMVMGANIGTTVTNTLISLGYARQKDEFRRAFSAATVHDFFNLLAVAIFLPLEIMFGFIERVALLLAEPLAGGGDYSMSEANVVSTLTSPVTDTVASAAAVLPTTLEGIAMILAGMALILVAIRYVGRLLKSLLVGRAQRILNASIGRGPLSGMASGCAVTVLVQSSTTSTSLMVPLAGSGALSLRQIYPFTLGANVGTTVTALLASTAVTGVHAVHALEIALVHLLFNVFALALIYGVPVLREIPLAGARWLASLAVKQKMYAVAWVLGTFILLPGALILATSLF
ncbi:Na/Pi symporter [Phytoactinopolyspora halotolerans]|uniref:Na/Pi cotransporter family protein n=1 Tax=Phytoactinopolyspora halotolerans TaxID=1981512 RepID=A0A6L9SK24_9ACTN|nr:Na/Pi symporter [Phytoactinopolyspora halotolerans]NEE04440.1 Na/Pi cotransporter family protein [Phytoactinopolyspora halotolerans]